MLLISEVKVHNKHLFTRDRTIVVKKPWPDIFNFSWACSWNLHNLHVPFYTLNLLWGSLNTVENFPMDQPVLQNQVFLTLWIVTLQNIHSALRSLKLSFHLRFLIESSGCLCFSGISCLCRCISLFLNLFLLRFLKSKIYRKKI